MKYNIGKIIKDCSKKAGVFIDKHSPEILMGCGIVGFVTTTVLVAKEAPIAKEKLDELHEDLAKSDEDLSKAQIIFEEFKAVAPVYAPAVISGGMSIGCIFASYRITTNRTAAIAAAYEFTQSSLMEYQEKVREKLGEKKEKQIRDEIAQERVEKNPPPKNYISAPIGDGQQWFYDPTTNQFFRSSVDDIRKAEKYIQHLLDTGCEDFASVNEFLYEIGSSEIDNSRERGDDFGFWADRDGISIRFSSVVAPGPLSALSLEYDSYSRVYTDHSAP